MPNRRRINTPSVGRRSFLFGLAATAAAVPLGAFGLHKATNGGLSTANGAGSGAKAITPIVNEAPLAEAISVLVDDAAIATQALVDQINPHRGVVKEIRSDVEFSQFALTWQGDPNISTYVRALRPDGTWSQWFTAEPDYPADGTGNGLNGTELIYVEPTTAVQVSSSGINVFGPGSGTDFVDIKGIDRLDFSQIDIAALGLDPKKLADDLHKIGVDIDVAKLLPSPQVPSIDSPNLGSAVDAGTEAAETGAEAATAANDAAATATDAAQDAPLPSDIAWADIKPVNDALPLNAVNAVMIDGTTAAGIAPIADVVNISGMPAVVSRAGWGANESMRRHNAAIDPKLEAATVHHTAGSNNYTQAQSAGIVRGIYHYHAQTLGWGDIGYNALVDKFGTIFEGRAGGLERNVQGAHAGGFNKGTFGISMMGDYSATAPSQAMLSSVGAMIGWRLRLAGIDPLSETRLTCSGYSGARYSKGETVTLPAIFAHRNTGHTTCPGAAGYSQMGTIRTLAKEAYDGSARDVAATDRESAGEVAVGAPEGSYRGSLGEIAEGIENFEIPPEVVDAARNFAEDFAKNTAQ